MSADTGNPIIQEEKDEAAVIKSLCSLIESKAAAALNQDPSATFNLGLSGGSLASSSAKVLSEHPP